ncbi:MAG TPA: amino acid permease, partial [Thermoanaerobaculia bacterium]
MASRLLAKKPLGLLLEEMKSDNRLRRILGPVQLTSLGVGAIIGAGIFVATGAAAHNVAGPALMMSYVAAGITCVFAALCYAEFASMVPVAGSAYTYAYATLGELFAWIIGWDLVLEYAVGSATVANGWSSFFQTLLPRMGIHLPEALASAPIAYDGATGDFVATNGVVNLPAIIITAIVTAVLVKGIHESANFNATMVAVKLVAVLFVILVGAFYFNPENWRPFAPYGWGGITIFGKTVFGKTVGDTPVGMLAGAAIIFFAYIGFDSVSTHAEEARRPNRDVPIGIIASLLICTVLYIAVVAVLTGMVKYDRIDTGAGVSVAFSEVG